MDRDRKACWEICEVEKVGPYSVMRFIRSGPGRRYELAVQYVEEAVDLLSTM